MLSSWGVLSYLVSTLRGRELDNLPRLASYLHLIKIKSNVDKIIEEEAFLNSVAENIHWFNLF